MNVKVGTFTAPAGTGNQAITGVGFKPKAVVVCSCNQTASGFNDGWNAFFGITDGTQSFVLYGVSQDNVATSSSRNLYQNARFIDIYNTAGTNISRATFVSMDADGFTVNWSVAGSSGVIISYLAIGGADISAYADVIDFPSGGGAVRVPFDAPFLLTFSTASNAVFAISTGMKTLAPGWFAQQTGAFQQGDLTAVIKTAVNPSDTFRYQRTDHASATLSNAGALDFEIAYVDKATGFNQTTSAQRSVVFLALGAVNCKAGSGTQPSTTGTQAITGLGFTPKAVIMGSVGNTASTVVAAEARLSYGFATATNQIFSMWMGDLDNVTPTTNASRTSTTSLVAMANPAASGTTSTLLAEATLSSLDSDGFTLNWTTVADTTAREYIWAAIGDTTAVVTTSGGSYAFAG